ncbi:MAG: universal stress protein [Chloroflexota bacterium]|nr:universal stress protein [Chloroflexota bacterium]
MRGRLRIYLGMAAGVGKTYTMLNEGRRRKSRGTDVVVGWVETHGRPLTQQQIGELEVIPRRRIAYRGVELEEMDLDALLARKPAVALVDELAHTNIPGSRNAKRYQDVEELLAAGITVITTVNVQHLEGVNDLVEAITGTRQRETLPDRVVDEANEIELVDISPEALRARMRHGNIYPPDRARLALERYFSVSNLTALRELALRRLSEKTERQLEAIMVGATNTTALRPAPAAVERVLVAFDARDTSRRLLHEGFRLAHGLRGAFLALTVRPADRPSTSGVESALALYKQLAEDLGAEVIDITVERGPTSERIAEAIAREVAARQVTLLVIGRPASLSATLSGWLGRLAGREARDSVVGHLLRLPLTADLYIAMR